MEQVAVVAAVVILIFIGPALQYLVAEKSYLCSFDMLCLHLGYCNIDQNIHYGQNKYKIAHYKGKFNSTTWLGDSVPQTRPDQTSQSAVQCRSMHHSSEWGSLLSHLPYLPAWLAGQLQLWQLLLILNCWKKIVYFQSCSDNIIIDNTVLCLNKNVQIVQQ